MRVIQDEITAGNSQVTEVVPRLCQLIPNTSLRATLLQRQGAEIPNLTFFFFYNNLLSSSATRVQSHKLLCSHKTIKASFCLLVPLMEPQRRAGEALSVCFTPGDTRIPAHTEKTETNTLFFYVCARLRRKTRHNSEHLLMHQLDTWPRLSSNLTVVSESLELKERLIKRCKCQLFLTDLS